eukprot:m.506801 g.506801  ORF g.506801 m.506801 type:complete len:815 (-) comp57374_c0_seq4:293-2737(-)
MDDIMFLDHTFKDANPNIESLEHESALQNLTLRLQVEKMHWKSARIYHHFSEAFQALIAQQPPDFMEEVELLKQRVRQHTETCNKRVDDRQKIAVPFASLKAQERRNPCDLMVLSDINMIDLVRHTPTTANALLSAVTTKPASPSSTFAPLPPAQAISFRQAEARSPIITEAPPKLFRLWPKCEGKAPTKKIVWLKTHKTGSSTLTNMFHRFAYKHRANLALAVDDMYYGWPFPGKTRDTVAFPPGSPNATFDMLVSGHAIYERPALERIVPNATYITILREPVTHLSSSWNFFQIYKRVLNDNGNSMTLSEFLTNPKEYFKRGNFFDIRLLRNGMAFDLGLDNELTRPSDIEAAVQQTANPSTGFDLVLLTEYMDESLVVLRHHLCWDIEDIIIFSLKRTTGASRSMMDLDSQRIHEFNTLDVALYQHFNRTLWMRAAAIPNFNEEVLHLRTLQENIRQACKDMNNTPERKKRFYFLTYPLSAVQQVCAGLTMDSVEFSRVFKKIQGLSDHDCSGFYPTGTAGFLKFHFVGPYADVITHLLYRRALRVKARVGIPAMTATQLGYTSKFTILTDDKREANAQFVANAFMKFNSSRYREGKLMAGTYGPFLAYIPDPIERFLTAWDEYDMENKLKAASLPFTIASALAGVGQDSKLAEILEPIRNTVAKDMELLSPKSLLIRDKLSELTHTHLFFLVLPGMEDHDRGLAYFGRASCWDFRELVHLQPIRSFHPSPDPVISAAIRAFNDADVEIHKFVSNHFKEITSAEIGLEDDIKRIHTLRSQFLQTCESFSSRSQQELREILLKPSVSFSMLF